MLDGARQAGRRFDARGIDRKFDGIKFVGPPAAFKDFFAPDERAPFEADGHARAVAACQVQLLPQLGLQYAVLAVAGELGDVPRDLARDDLLDRQRCHPLGDRDLRQQ